ncbi:TetR/AcrR family transcriptional regulator [Tianweitania sp.]|uniref:TetR/AcrR family transcriptional regulator n=1 Tax=Tianweitania sp. TaxID=2021634 RepID=UPI00289C6B8D|nr:TetR/AcrR family transcriptional regulator [Tianweitania sp.]
MASSERRAKLKERLVEAATDCIRANGLGGLRARDITTDAGCSLGALYNVFADIDDLVVHVNSQTLRHLRDVVDKAGQGTSSPSEQLVALAIGYLNFARSETAVWMSLFEHRMPAGVLVPQWHLDEHAALIEQIAEPLAALHPELEQAHLLRRARTLFSAVHGVVLLGLGDWFVGPGASAVEDELRLIVNAMISGLAADSTMPA